LKLYYIAIVEISEYKNNLFFGVKSSGRLGGVGDSMVDYVR
jgi:hypothetical protein